MFLYSVSWYGDTQENKLFQSAKKTVKVLPHSIMFFIQYKYVVREKSHIVLLVLSLVFFTTRLPTCTLNKYFCLFVVV